MDIQLGKTTLQASILTISLGFTMTALAGVPADEVARLGNDLTPFGAEREGNESGTIPAWSPDPVSLEKVLADEPEFTISSKNYQNYSDQLSTGLEAMFEKYSDSFEMHVYPTRRTHRLPDWVYDYTEKNASEAELIENGNGLENAYGGIPFPIPQSAEEIVWNHIMRWRGIGQIREQHVYAVHSDGSMSHTQNQLTFSFSYYQPGGEDTWNGLNGYVMNETSLPSRRSGEILLVHEPMNTGISPRKSWQYIPGQRRVRRAPTVEYDTPVPGANGNVVYDESFQFNGALDKYNWELIGKEERFVPYNDNRFVTQTQEGVTPESLFQAGHPDPDLKRWELHRVWVVEATLKDDERHVYAKRRFYIDEDSWIILLSEAYDGRDQLWKVNYATPFYSESLPGLVLIGNIYQDLIGDSYVVEHSLPPVFKPVEEDFFSLQNLRRKALR